MSHLGALVELVRVVLAIPRLSIHLVKIYCLEKVQLYHPHRARAAAAAAAMRGEPSSLP